MTPRKDKLLFTPGPLTTSDAVKEAMLRDVGSRDAEFVNVVREIRQSLLGVAGVSQADGYEAILLQADGDAVTLKVSDDGQGFDPQAMNDRGGLGLVSMQERAERIGGRLAIHSAPGEGTTIVVQVRGDSNE